MQTTIPKVAQLLFRHTRHTNLHRRITTSFAVLIKEILHVFRMNSPNPETCTLPDFCCQRIQEAEITPILLECFQRFYKSLMNISKCIVFAVFLSWQQLNRRRSPSTIGSAKPSDTPLQPPHGRRSDGPATDVSTNSRRPLDLRLSHAIITPSV